MNITDTLREVVPTLVPIDPAEAGTKWQYLGIPAGIASWVLALVFVELAIRRARTRSIATSDFVLVYAVAALFVFLGLGLLMCDVGWVGVGFAIALPVLAFKRLRDGTLE